MGSHLNDKVQGWAKTHSPVYVISGVVLDANNDGQRDPDDTYSRYCVCSDIGCDIHTYVCYGIHTKMNTFLASVVKVLANTYRPPRLKLPVLCVYYCSSVTYICTCSAALKFS